jgi:hypothetical protein
VHSGLGRGQFPRQPRAPGVIGSKHLGLVHAVAAIRNASGHGIDQRENEDWHITARAAALIVATVIVAIRSIHAYVEASRLEL